MTSPAIGKTNIVTNPATGERLAELSLHSISDLEDMLVRSAAAQRKWARVPRHERSALMLRYVEVLRTHHEELSKILTRDNGKTIDQARAEIDNTIRIFKGFAERILAWHEEARFLDSQPGLEGDVQLTHHEPLGVIAAIVPFNFPSELQAWKVAPAIATGNTVVVKPSSLTPLVGTREIELMAEAGFPADIVQVIHGSREIGSGLASHPLVAGLSLTGSTEAGISVATAGAKTLKRVGLELGGNDAAIVLADANMDLVVEQAVIGRSVANGQVCCATKRIIVEGSVADTLIERLAESFGGLRLGNPLEATTQLGPLVDTRAAANVSGQVNQAISQGARRVAGGSGPDGAFYAATVIVDQEASTDVSHNTEIFGPVLDIIPFDSVDRAVEIANASVFGLSGSVFSADIGRAMTIALEMQTGQVVINGTGNYRADESAWGGYKLSGNDREGLGLSLQEFMQTKTLTLRQAIKR